MNPSIEAETNAKIRTGSRTDKFGIPASRVSNVYKELCENASLEPQGLPVHIGSQLTDLSPFRRAFAQMTSLVHELRDMGMPVRALTSAVGLASSIVTNRRSHSMTTQN